VDQSERARLEVIARDVARDWNIVLSRPFGLLNYSYVAPAGDDAVLKVVSPHDEESIHEADALELWAGDGAVRALRVDRPRRSLLLERVWPGSDLAVLADAPATEIAVDVASRLWRPAAAPFHWIGHHVPRWLAQAQPESAAGRRLLDLARERFDELDVRSDTLVHGDLHHHNILNAGTRYVAIDPKPMVGEPEFDVPPFLWNATGSRMTREETERRLSVFAAAGLDERRMRAWALIRGAYLTVGDWVGDHAVEVLEAIQSC
jgi:streptomycin 6-kinase